MEMKSLGVVFADAVHHQLVLLNSLTTCVAGFAIGDTAENLRAVVSWQNPAFELSPNKTTQRLFRRHDAPLADAEGLDQARRESDEALGLCNDRIMGTSAVAMSRLSRIASAPQ